ncbi:LPS biosynthesis protein [Pseudomonas massiliensis]|uniref:LPS biosynthesis protein n=1 Tax=Pseudomonas massiliensis TaxID=522492 RepID=UPI0005902908|nr:LPS biosynthesis protein [Pseudomonas massiliensis]
MSSLATAQPCFSACRDTRQGPVIILASGPSTQDFPLEEFASIPIITMNGAISRLLPTSIEPLFYVCTDRGFPLQQPELYEAAVARARHLALWPDEIARLAPSRRLQAYALRRAPATCWRHIFGKEREQAVRSRNVLSKRCRSIGFSQDMSYGFFDARTVAYVCAQLAYHLGFEKVFLVGVDLDGTAQRFYDRETRTLSPCGLNDHFDTRIVPSFEVLQRAFRRAGRQVFNLSARSRLPASVIPRADLGTLRRALYGSLTGHGNP